MAEKQVPPGVGVTVRGWWLGARCQMHPTRLDREKSTDQCVTSCSGAGLNLGTIKTRSRPTMSREGVNQRPHDPFSSRSRPQTLGHSHAPVGGKQRLPKTVSMPSAYSPPDLVSEAHGWTCPATHQPYKITTGARTDDATQRHLLPSMSAQFSEVACNSQHPPPNMLLVPGSTKGKGKTTRGPNLKEGWLSAEPSLSG